MAITVYLDSSDYSNLAAHKNLADLRERLLKFAKQNHARFVYSGVVICEMAPRKSTYTSSATSRAKVLVTLCRRNTLPSIDRLLDREFEALHRETIDSSDLIDPNGNWFPDMGPLAKPSQALRTAMVLSEEISKNAQNRQQRRAAKSLTLKDGKLRPSGISHLLNGDLTEILDQYPMRPQDARVIERYVLGVASAADADKAFLESLRDPDWMMRWFEKHHDRLDPVTQWVRGPSENLLKIVDDLAKRFSNWITDDGYTADFIRQMLKTDRWKQEQDKLLLNVANRLLEPRNQTVSSAEVIGQFCPGLTTWIRSAHNSIRLSLLEKHPRLPKSSDFVDSLHAMYAPYVDLFRADAYMAPILKPLVERHGTVVSEKLSKVPDEIMELREKRQ